MKLHVTKTLESESIPSETGFLQTNIVSSIYNYKKIADVFSKINSDLTPDKQAAAKANRISKKLR